MPNIVNYLRDDSYNINLSLNKIYINNYKELKAINENFISIQFDEFLLNINGSSFKVAKMVDNEILFNGHIESMEYIYK